MTDLKCAILPIFICLISYYAQAIDPQVETRLGLIQGLTSTDGEYSMFMGIPYATVDEANPFGASTPHPAFDDVFEAFDDTAMCPQIEEFNNTVVGNLDCLHLNIYVPNSATSINRLPVLVWIHGGGWSFGFSGTYVYGPSFLIRHDIILVTLNYRMGAFGFMCLDTPEIPGNQGMKDQELALKWVKDNIESFGGDANKITLFGESAGSASVDLHLFFNKEILFHQILMQSGTAVAEWAIVDSDTTKPMKLANHLGFSTDNLNEALDFLTSVDPHLVIAATSELGLSFRPCVEKSFEGVERLITEYPLNIDIPRIRDVPVLIGTYNDERVTDVLTMNEDTIHAFSAFLGDYFNFDEDQLASMESLVRNYYIGDENVNEETKWLIADFRSHFRFVYPTQRAIKKFIENNANVVYQYLFSYNGERNFVKERHNMTEGGAAHADEISYLFDVSYMTEEPSLEDQLVIDRMTTLWANFVKYGNPTPETSTLLPVTWQPVTEDRGFYLNIDSELTLESRPFYDSMAFWDLFYELNYKNQLGYRES